MKRAIAVQEILRRILIVEDNGNLEEALTDVRKSYKKERIVLDDSDLIPNPMTGESAEIFEADWIDLEEVQHMELSGIKQVSGVCDYIPGTLSE